MMSSISKTTLERFQACRWPGNVRELQYAVEHAMNILPNELSTITQKYIPEHILSGEGDHGLRPMPERGAASLNVSIRDAAYQTVCRALNMSRQNLQYRIKRYQINIDELLKE